jgi:hypothetical protein
MMWVMVILTVAGGSISETQSSLAQCQRSLINIRTSDAREAYCMSVGTDDRVYFIKDGKQIVEIR